MKTNTPLTTTPNAAPTVVRNMLTIGKFWRLGSFSQDGEFLDARPLESRQFYSSQSLFVDTLGNVYVRTFFVDPENATAGRGLLMLGLDGEVRDTLLEPDWGYEAPRLELTVRSGKSVARTIMAIPFLPRPVWTFSPHGYYVAGVGDRYAVSLFRTDKPVLRIERDVAPVAVDPEEKAAWQKSLTANMHRMSSGWRWRGPPIPDTKPAFRQLKVGLDGRIWVWLYQQAEKQEVEPPGEGPANPRQVWPEPTVFDVFDPDGRYVGAVRVPGETTIHVMKGDHVWVVTRDSLDVQYIERFRLVGGMGSRESGVGSGEFD